MRASRRAHISGCIQRFLNFDRCLDPAECVGGAENDWQIHMTAVYLTDWHLRDAHTGNLSLNIAGYGRPEIKTKTASCYKERVCFTVSGHRVSARRTLQSSNTPKTSTDKVLDTIKHRGYITSVCIMLS